MELKTHSRETYFQASEFFFNKHRDIFIPCEFSFSEEERKHIIHIGASIMMNRDGVLPGGGFVQALCDNKLTEAFNRADSTMIKVMRYMVWIMNYGYVDDVLSEISFVNIETI